MAIQSIDRLMYSSRVDFGLFFLFCFTIICYYHIRSNRLMIMVVERIGKKIAAVVDLHIHSNVFR